MATPHPLADRAAATDNNTVAALYTKPENLQVTNLMHKSINSNSAGSAELTAVVDDLLNQLHTKFTTVSSELLSKMDDMSRRLDNLEATIQAGDGSKASGSGK